MGNRKDNKIPDEIKQQIVERLSELLESKDMKAATLAKKAGMSKSNLYCILRGETVPTIYSLLQICEVLEVSPAFFFKGLETGEETPDSVKEMFLIENMRELSERDKTILLEISRVMLRLKDNNMT